MSVRRKLLTVALSVVAGVALLGAGTAMAAPPSSSASGTLYFTLYNNQGTCTTNCQPNVFRVPWSYNGSNQLTLGTQATVATLKGADGIIFTPDNNLLIGGQNTGNVYEITTSGTVLNVGASGIGEVDHLTLNGSTIYTSGPTTSAGGSTLATLSWPDLIKIADQAVPGGVTQLAFLPGQTNTAYYTSSGYQGSGNFGTIDLTNDTVTVLARNVPYAHGIVYDPFSGDFIIAGNNEIAQWSPTSGLTSVYIAPPTSRPGGLGNTEPNVFDQVSVDGNGHLFAAANNGYLYFIDYSHSPQNISAAGNYVSIQFLRNGLDDIADQLPEVPYAVALPLMLIPALMLVRRKRRLLPQH